MDIADDGRTLTLTRIAPETSRLAACGALALALALPAGAFALGEVQGGLGLTLGGTVLIYVLAVDQLSRKRLTVHRSWARLSTVGRRGERDVKGVNADEVEEIRVAKGRLALVTDRITIEFGCGLDAPTLDWLRAQVVDRFAR